MRKWICQVCGYTHEGEEPPETCPVCGAAKTAFEEAGKDMTQTTDTEEETARIPENRPKKKSWQEGKNFWEKAVLLCDDTILRHHLHPISVHIPNGVLPIAFIFTLLGILLGESSLKTAGFFNMCMVMLSMPLVVYTGVVVWRDRYGASLTPLFRAKILCAGVLGFCALVLVLWRAFSPSAGGPFYIFLHIVALGAAVVAGHLGSKLVFGGRPQQ